MKYIVTVLDGEECIFLFPREVNHDYFAEAMEAIRFGNFRDWTRGKFKQGDIVSAGFVTNGVCHGRSESLNIDSRPKQDTELLKQMLSGQKLPKVD